MSEPHFIRFYHILIEKVKTSSIQVWSVKGGALISKTAFNKFRTLQENIPKQEFTLFTSILPPKVAGFEKQTNKTKHFLWKINVCKPLNAKGHNHVYTNMSECPLCVGSAILKIGPSLMRKCFKIELF